MALYCFDTSALMDAWNRYYPPDVLPPLWEKLDSFAATGVAICPDEVLKELSKKDDALHMWAKKRPKLFLPLDVQIQAEAAAVLAVFPRLVDTRKNRSIADPFVIGTAKVRKATLVTGERATGTHERPRIPNVCAHFGIPCISMLQLIREQGWVFRLAAG